MVTEVNKITRERIRAMNIGDQLVTVCADGYAQESQKNSAYAMKKNGYVCSCRTEGLRLTVTRVG